LSTPSEQPDEQLVAKYLASRSAADLDELFVCYLGMVRNVAYRIVLCHAAADDITQEVFVKVIRNLPKFQGKSSFSTWLYRITVNTAKEHLRKISQIQKLQENKKNETTSEPQKAPPEQAVIFDETLVEVERALAKLSTKMRTAIVLTAIEQLSPKEAAAIEGCSTATMHWRIHQARKQLKQLLHEFLSL